VTRAGCEMGPEYPTTALYAVTVPYLWRHGSSRSKFGATRALQGSPRELYEAWPRFDAPSLASLLPSPPPQNHAGPRRKRSSHHP